MNDSPLGLRVSEVAQRLGVSMGTVRRWSDDGHLEYVRTPGGQRRYSEDAVRMFLVRLAAPNLQLKGGPDDHDV